MIRLKTALIVAGAILFLVLMASEFAKPIPCERALRQMDRVTAIALGFCDPAQP